MELNYRQVTQHALIQQLRSAYLRTLQAPLNGMWEGAVIAQATFWEIHDQERPVGHFCLDADHVLLRFALLTDQQVQAQEIFRWLISICPIQSAMASTLEVPYFALCLDMQKHIVVQQYLFRDQKHIAASADPGKQAVQKAGKQALPDIIHFYREHTAGAGEWIASFVQKRLAREELYLWYHEQTMVAVGECIPSQSQPPYADLGMIVAQACRGQGLGTAVLLYLKERCYTAGWEPICSCAVENQASKKAIERAGFLSEQRIVKVTF